MVLILRETTEQNTRIAKRVDQITEEIRLIREQTNHSRIRIQQNTPSVKF